MNLKYVKGSYMDEIMYEGRPVLFTLDGLDEGHEGKRLSDEIKGLCWLEYSN